MRSDVIVRLAAAFALASMVAGGCGSQVELSNSDEAVAHWLGRAYSEGSISAQDLFFEAFWMSDATFSNDTGAWACLFEGVVAELTKADDQGALARLASLSAADPDNPVEHRSEIEETLAALPKDVRVRLGEAVAAGDGRCGDVRIGMFGGGGPTPVCIWTHTTDEQRAEIVASSIGAVYPDQFEWSEDVRVIVKACYTEIDDAYGSGGTLEWVEDLEADWQVYWNEMNATTTSTP